MAGTLIVPVVVVLMSLFLAGAAAPLAHSSPFSRSEAKASLVFMIVVYTTVTWHRNLLLLPRWSFLCLFSLRALLQPHSSPFSRCEAKASLVFMMSVYTTVTWHRMLLLLPSCQRNLLPSCNPSSIDGETYSSIERPN